MRQFAYMFLSSRNVPFLDIDIAYRNLFVCITWMSNLERKLFTYCNVALYPFISTLIIAFLLSFFGAIFCWICNFVMPC